MPSKRYHVLLSEAERTYLLRCNSLRCSFVSAVFFKS